jgi:F-type H+-transporting ATPase subunit alpha
MLLYAITGGYFDDVPIDQVTRWEEALYSFVDINYPELEQTINTDKEIKADLKEILKTALLKFKQGVTY